VEVLDDVESVEKDLRIGGVLADQSGVRHPHIHAHDAERMATPHAHFFGKERSHRLFGPVVSDPQQCPALQVVNHREIDLALTPAHLIDANHMDRGPRAVA
jgi:hypothetical protein